jgi:eukaryotic-like serine/threonine-protein kinase
MDPHAGMMIGESLRLHRHLSEGGMASLWLAEDLRGGERAVVKFPSSRFARCRDVVDRLRREAIVTSMISSPHVVRVFEFIEGREPPCLVMEFLEGEDLATRLERRGSLGLVETAQIIHQTASALESAHRLGVIHRDVKPENMFLCESSGTTQVKLLDFGIARIHAGRDAMRITDPGVKVGTPLYMSPEQLLGVEEDTSRCDVLLAHPPVVASMNTITVSLIG